MASQNQSNENVKECNEVCTLESTTLCKSENTSDLDDNKLTNEGKRLKSDTCMRYCKTCHFQMSETDTEQHKGHGIVSLSMAANRLKQTLEESITKIKRKNEKLHKSCLENIEQNNDENRKLKIESLHNVLNDEYRRVKRVIQHSLTLSSAKRDRESQYEEYLEDLQKTQSSLDENIKTLDEILNEIEKCSDADLLRKEATFNNKMEKCETVQHLPLFDVKETNSFIQALYSDKDKENLKQTAKEHEQLRKEREYFENGFETVMSLLKSLLDYRGNNKNGIGFFCLPALPGGIEPFSKKMGMKDRRKKANDDLNRFRNIAVKLIDFERVKEQVEVDSNKEPKTKDSRHESTTTESETQLEETKETTQRVQDQNARMKTIIKTIGEWINICHKSVKQSEVDKIELTLPSEHVMNDQGKKTLETYRKKLEDICQRKEHEQLHFEREYFENTFETVMTLLQSLVNYRENKEEKKENIKFSYLPNVPVAIERSFRKKIKTRQISAEDKLQRLKNIVIELIDLERQIEAASSKKRTDEETTHESAKAENETQNDETMIEIQRLTSENERMRNVIKAFEEWINICHNNVQQNEVDPSKLTLPSEQRLDESGMQILKTNRKKLEAIREQLSKIAGSKLTDNNPGITDLSDPNRLTRLAAMFGEIYDNVWTNTIESLIEKKRIKTEKEAVLHMASILKVCYIYCENKFEETLEQMEGVLLMKSQKKSGDVELDKKEQKQLKGMLKTMGVRTSKCLDQDDLTKYVTDRNLQKAMQKHQDVTKDFTKQCLEICWLMVIQDPPVVLYWGDSTVGSPIDADRFKAFTRSGDSLEYIVWPAVLLHINGPLLNKGIVQPEELDTKP